MYRPPAVHFLLQFPQKYDIIKTTHFILRSIYHDHYRNWRSRLYRLEFRISYAKSTPGLPHCLSGQADLRWQSVHAGACHGQPEFPVCQAGYLRP